MTKARRSAAGTSPPSRLRAMTSTARKAVVTAAPYGSLREPLDQGRVGAVALQLGEDLGEGLADDPAPVDRDAVLAAQQQAGVLEVHELLGGAVDGHLLVVPLAAARRPPGGLPVVLPATLGRLLGSPGPPALLDRGDAEQLVGSWQARPTLHDASTSLASSRYATAPDDEPA